MDTEGTVGRIVAALAAGCGLTLAAGAGEAPGWTGKVLHAEHYAYVWAGIPEGLGGPAKLAGKAHAWAFCAQDAAGNFFVAEPQNDQVH
jgi:hypothetical protein